jgi:hypothetical protein
MAMRSQKDGLRRAPESYLLRPIAPSATLTWRPGLPISNLQCEITSSSRSPVVWLSSALAMNGGRRCRAAAACCHSAMPPTPGKGPCRVLAKKKKNWPRSVHTPLPASARPPIITALPSCPPSSLALQCFTSGCLLQCRGKASVERDDMVTWRGPCPSAKGPKLRTQRTASGSSSAQKPRVRALRFGYRPGYGRARAATVDATTPSARTSENLCVRQPAPREPGGAASLSAYCTAIRFPAMGWGRWGCVGADRGWPGRGARTPHRRSC